MIRKVRANLKKSIGLIIPLLSLVIITFALTGFSQHPNYGVNGATLDNQILKQQIFLETNLGEPNKKTNSVEVANLNYDYSSVTLTKASISLNTSKFETNEQPDPQSQLSHSFPDFTYNQLTKSDIFPPIGNTDSNVEEKSDTSNVNNNEFAAPIITASSSANTLNFTTYTYGGYLIRQTDSNQFFFSFPDNTCQGEVAGSDCITLNSYSITKIDFDAIFTAPKINALGFDEMAVFAASDTSSYKGPEFGIRLDLSEGYIYGYNQEPNGNNVDVNFQMLKLTPNDGAMHHYSIIMLGSEVAFYIDGTDYGHLTFPSQTDYSNLPFSILAVVHRFTDDWDSTGDNMTVENFNLNSQ